MINTTNFAEAAEAYIALVRQIRSDQWHGPGLGEWDLRALVGHASRSLITVGTYLDKPAEDEAITSPYAYIAWAGSFANGAAVAERGRQAGAALGDDPTKFVEALVARVTPRVVREDDPLIETIAGGMRLSNYLPTRTFELVVHGLDIASAAGLDLPAYSDALLTEVATIAATAAVLGGRGPELILALTGRTTLAEGFSVI